MKKTIVGLGLIAILFGLILLFSSAYSYVTSKSEWQESMKQWTASADLNKSQVIGFSFRPDNDWSIETYSLQYVDINGQQMPVKYLEVNVTTPQAGYTAIRILLVITQLNGGASHISVYQDYFEIFNKTDPEAADWIKANRSSGFEDPTRALNIEKGYPRIETLEGDNIFQLGKAPIPGTYNLTFTLDPLLVNDRLAPNNTLWVHEASPPAILRIYETTINTEYPYTLLLPFGVPISVIGVIIAWWGYQRKKLTGPTPATKNDKNQ